MNVVGDRRALEKVIINLVNNAIKFTPARGKVTVRFAVMDDFVEMIVEDTGPGIEKANFEMIFDRFQQVDSSSTRKYQGTGLGLALVKELVELQGGNVVVESDVGHGAIFTVRLPLGQGDEKVKSLIEQGGQFLGDIHTRARYASGVDYFDETSVNRELDASVEDGRPVLVVIEDEPDVRSYLAEALKDDFVVHTAATGKLGWDLMKSAHPDLVITDLMLPELDGLTICKMAREDEELRNTKIMLLTARTDEKSKLDALDNGADDFLTKPFSTIEIKKRLSNLWLTSQLQNTVHERNLELEATLSDLQSTQGKLIQSEKLNALGRLASGLLHEVNNPLNYAYGTFQLLEREPAMKEQEHIQEMMGDVRDGMERISAIVKDLKTFAYPEAVHMTQEFDIAEAISSAERLSAHSLRGINIEKELGDSSVVVGSQSHIVQVLINLFENACHAMENTGGESRLLIRCQVTNTKRLSISVRDSGTGIPEDIMEKVFDPFFTTKEVGTGLGMGLSTCHTIIDNHGGSLSVDTDSASYTEFYFDLALPGGTNDKHPEGDN
jgi:signal transduction histidine kinase